LNDIENGIRDFQTSNATVSFEEQRSLLLREAAELDKEIDGFERRRSGLTQRIRALEEEMAAQAQQIPLDEESEAESIEAQLAAVEAAESVSCDLSSGRYRPCVSVRPNAVVERFLG
jgi:predicted  nucleic acid-binding Zn-ribbon protein